MGLTVTVTGPPVLQDPVYAEDVQSAWDQDAHDIVTAARRRGERHFGLSVMVRARTEAERERYSRGYSPRGATCSTLFPASRGVSAS